MKFKIEVHPDSGPSDDEFNVGKFVDPQSAKSYVKGGDNWNFLITETQALFKFLICLFSIEFDKVRIPIIQRIEQLSSVPQDRRPPSDLIRYHLHSKIVEQLAAGSNMDLHTNSVHHADNDPNDVITANLILTAGLANLSNDQINTNMIMWTNTQAIHKSNQAASSVDVGKKRSHSPTAESVKTVKPLRSTHANDLIPQESQLCSNHMAAILGLSNDTFPPRSECPRGSSCRNIHLNGLESYGKAKILRTIDGSTNRSFARQVALRKLVVEKMK
jgi:hypothetical protein